MVPASQGDQPGAVPAVHPVAAAGLAGTGHVVRHPGLLQPGYGNGCRRGGLRRARGRLRGGVPVRARAGPRQGTTASGISVRNLPVPAPVVSTADPVPPRREAAVITAIVFV